MTQLRTRVDRLEQAEASAVQYGASSDDLANFPGMMNLAAGDGVTLTPSAGTLTISSSASGSGSGSDLGTASVSLAVDSTWYNTGSAVSLAAGTYLVCASCRGSMTLSAGTGAIIGRLYDATAGAAITGSQFCVIRSDFVGESQATGSIQKLVTVATTSTIRIEAQRASGATYTVSTTLSDTSGQTSITYVRLY